MSARNEAIERGAHLSQALKALRRRRGLTIPQMAKAMGMAVRSYEHFESGRPQLNIDRVHKAAEVLEADPYALLAAVDMGCPAFAVRCAGNQMMALIMFAAQDFNLAVGDDILLLDPATLMQHFERVFDALAEVARQQRALLSGGPKPEPEPESNSDPDTAAPD